MKISIALCTFNGERFLPEQLSSIGRQTCPPDEVLVFDDGSSDSTLSIVDEFKKNSDFSVSIRVNETTLGSTRNFEKAIKNCRGDLIVLSDQDDIWMDTKIETLASIFRSNSETGVVFSDAELINERSESTGGRLWDTTFTKGKRVKFDGGAQLQVLAWGDTVTGATMAFRSSLIKFLSPTPDVGIYSHDSWIALTLALVSQIDYVSKPLIKYRIHGEQQIGIRLEERRKDHLSTDEDMYAEAIRTARIVLTEFSKLALKLDGQISLEHSSLVKENLKSFEEHFLTRRELPSARVRRLPEIFREIARGNYHKHSLGFRSALKDLVRGARAE